MKVKGDVVYIRGTSQNLKRPLSSVESSVSPDVCTLLDVANFLELLRLSAPLHDGIVNVTPTSSFENTLGLGLQSSKSSHKLKTYSNGSMR